MSLQIDDRRVVEVVNYSLEHGDDETCATYGLKQESLARYKREYKKRFGNFERRKIIDQIAANYSDSELKAIAAGSMGGLGSKKHIVERAGKHVKIGAITDTHIGSKFFRPELLQDAFHVFREEGCDFVTHSGDVAEGMSNRPGHVYELDKIGYTAQKKYAIDLLSEWKGRMYLIDGNHDRWFVLSNGAYIVQDITDSLPDGVYLGSDEGDIIINDAIVKLWHGGDGSSYATSYRLQKLVESLSGGTKPHVIIAGHTHKQGYFFERNIHVVSGGSIQLQSKWMRGKRLAAHTGYHIIDMEITDDGVTRFRVEWFPFFL